jgi:hypothetical protein
MTDRDFAAEMRAVIDAETANGPYVSATVAAHIVEKLTATDPDLLDGWLHAGAVQFLRHAINLRDCSARTHARHMASRSVFRQAAEDHEDGDETALVRFLDTRYVIEDGSRVRLAEMRKPDLVFVADDYAARARENALQEAFLRALAKKVGRGRVSDHFTDEQLTAMWTSVTGG